MVVFLLILSLEISLEHVSHRCRPSPPQMAINDAVICGNREMLFSTLFIENAALLLNFSSSHITHTNFNLVLISFQGVSKQRERGLWKMRSDVGKIQTQLKIS